MNIRDEKNTLKKYNTGKKIHKKQLVFHKCKKKNRWVFGGNRSGKTECGAVECIYLARGIHPYKKITAATDGWVVSLSSQVQRDVAQAKILQYLNSDWIVDIIMSQGRKDSPARGVIDKLLIKNVFGTISTIGFKSCDQGREKFQGTSLDYIWFDEEPPEDIYAECKMRIFDKDGIIFGTMTPLKGTTYIYDEIYLNSSNNEDVWHIFMSWDDNPFLPSGAKKQLSASMSSEQLKSRKFGEFLTLGGRVYNEFDESIHVIEPFDIPREWQDKISIDPGLKNPLSAHWYAQDYDGNIYVIAEHYEREKDIDYHSDQIKKISASLNWKMGISGKLEAIIDSASNQTTLASSKSVSQLFFERDIAVNTNVNKELFSGISRVKSYLKDGLGRSKLFIFKSCVNMIREIKGYQWGSGDNPIKRDDHSMDELRYYIMTMPENKPAKNEPNEVQKHKIGLMRRRLWNL